jgi:hypothetical protein
VHQNLTAGDILKVLDIGKLTKESTSGACAPEPDVWQHTEGAGHTYVNRLKNPTQVRVHQNLTAGDILKVLDIRKLTKESTSGACSPVPDGWRHTEGAGHT